MNNIYAYELITRSSIIEFNIEMERKISEGWIPFGNLQIISFPCGASYNQAVVKYKIQCLIL